MQWDKNSSVYILAEQCPLIEEARWFITIVPKVCSAESEDEIVDLFFKNGRTPRHVAYTGIITRNPNLIREAAFNGDAAAQFRMASMPGHSEDSNMWLAKSLAAGYSEAFKASAHRALRAGDRQKDRILLQQGIMAAAQSSIAAYANIDGVSEQETLYYTGQVWLMFHTNKNLQFVKLVDRWYGKSYDTRDRTSGFIIGQIFNRLNPQQIDQFTMDKFNGLFYQALQVAHQMYLVMCKRTQHAVVTWMLISKHLPIVKDIRKVIAVRVWMTRDQSDWS